MFGGLGGMMGLMGSAYGNADVVYPVFGPRDRLSLDFGAGTAEGQPGNGDDALGTGISLHGTSDTHALSDYFLI
jgi:hypothetical protein